jgi:predicted SprT family Zn-dependent metalloprotease
MVVGFTTTCAVSTTKVVSSNPAHVGVYSIQHYMIKFASDLRQIGSFLLVLRFPPPIKLNIKNLSKHYCCQIIYSTTLQLTSEEKKRQDSRKKNNRYSAKKCRSKKKLFQTEIQQVKMVWFVVYGV